VDFYQTLLGGVTMKKIARILIAVGFALAATVAAVSAVSTEKAAACIIGVDC
jgi:hypothetical protein